MYNNHHSLCNHLPFQATIYIPINCCFILCLYYLIDMYKIMAEKVDKRIPKNLFVNMMVEKATIIREHLKCKENMCPLIIVANIGPTMAVFKFYDTTAEDDSLKLHMTLSNLGDIDEQIHILWQQVNFLLHQYCSQCGNGNVDSASTSH